MKNKEAQEGWRVPRITCIFAKYNRKYVNIFYCSIKSTYVFFLVLNLSSHKSLTS